jgi:hypothetical protein
MKSFRELSLTRKISVILLYTRMNLRAIFGFKALFFLVGTALYFAIFCVVVAKTDAGLTLEQALAWLVWMPSTLFAVFFSMEVISREREAGVLETFFTVSVSVYRLWIIKFITLLCCVALLALALIVAAERYVMEIPILLTLLYVLPPLLFFAGLTVLFSALFKSGNAAGICVAAILGLVLLMAEGLSTTVVYPYLNPLVRPDYTEPFIWIRAAVYNKIAYTLLGCLWFWRALRWLDRRERLLR